MTKQAFERQINAMAIDSLESYWLENDLAPATYLDDAGNVHPVIPADGDRMYPQFSEEQIRERILGSWNEADYVDLEDDYDLGNWGFGDPTK